MAFYRFGLGLVLASVSGCNSPAENENQIVGDNIAVATIPSAGRLQAPNVEEANVEEVSAEDWRLGAFRDPMTDEAGLVAYSTQPHPSFPTEVAVQCIGGKRLQYGFHFKSARGDQVRIDRLSGIPPLEIRFDDARPARIKLPNLRYANLIELKDTDTGQSIRHAGALKAENALFLSGDTVMYPAFTVLKMGLANRLRVRAALNGGDGFFVIEQGAPAIQKVLQSCGVTWQALAKAEQDAVAAETERLRQYEISTGEQPSGNEPDTVEVNDQIPASDEVDQRTLTS